MKPITVTIWRYNRNDGSFSPSDHHRSASPNKATQWAIEKLGEAHLTKFQSHKRLDFAIVTRRNGKEKTIEQPVHYVPSCGELGWW